MPIIYADYEARLAEKACSAWARVGKCCIQDLAPHSSALPLAQQVHCIAQLAMTEQLFVIELLDTMLAQAGL